MDHSSYSSATNNGGPGHLSEPQRAFQILQDRYNWYESETPESIDMPCGYKAFQDASTGWSGSRVEGSVFRIQSLGFKAVGHFWGLPSTSYVVPS